MTSDPNDLTTFLDEAWRHLQRGVADSRAPARYPTFATVAADGTPEARTVALRGASRSLSTLEVHTDIATAKAAFLVWLPRANLQIRVTTTVDIQTGSAVDEQWDRIPAASRVSYGTEPTPGTVISDVYAYEKPSKRERFAVLHCNMLFINLVQLGERHRRAGYSCKNGWMGEWLAP